MIIRYYWLVLATRYSLLATVLATLARAIVLSTTVATLASYLVVIVLEYKYSRSTITIVGLYEVILTSHEVF
jgi:hypothetical protein